MEPLPDWPPTRWVQIYQNNRITSFQSLSGLAFAVPDAEGVVRNVPAGAADEMLGEALRDALNHSRFLAPHEIKKSLTDYREIERVFKMRMDLLAQDSGFSSRRRIFQSLRFCSVTMRHGEISFEPTEHIRGDEWRDLRTPPIVIADDADASALGAAVRLAMSKCKA